jgi:hypothetical protein
VSFGGADGRNCGISFEDDAGASTGILVADNDRFFGTGTETLFPRATSSRILGSALLIVIVLEIVWFIFDEVDNSVVCLDRFKLGTMLIRDLLLTIQNQECQRTKLTKKLCTIKKSRNE